MLHVYSGVFVGEREGNREEVVHLLSKFDEKERFALEPSLQTGP